MTRRPATAVAVAASIGAGLIHLGLGPEHLDELGALGWGFYVAAALQLGWAIGVLAVHARHARHARPLPRVGVTKIAVAGILMNVAILAAWVVSRTVGLPTGEIPWVPEPVGRADLVSAVLEIAIVMIATAQVRTRITTAGLLAVPDRVRGRRRLAPLVATLSVAAIIAGTAVGLAPDGVDAAAHADGHAGQMHMQIGIEQPAR